MKISKKVQILTALFVGFASFLIFSTNTFAATRTWDGGGEDDNLATAENWVGDVAPINGDSLSFTTEDSIEVINNLNSSVTINGINVVTDSFLNISGGLLKIQGTVEGNITFTTDLNIADDTTFIGSAYFDGNLSGSGNVTLSDEAGATNFYIRGADNSGFNGDITTGHVVLCVNVNSNIFGSNSGSTSLSGSIALAGVQSDVVITENINFGGRIDTTGYSCNQGGLRQKRPHKITLNGSITTPSDKTFFSGDVDLVIPNAVSGGGFTVLDGSLASITVNGQTEVSDQDVIIVESTDHCPYMISANTKYVIKVDCSPSGINEDGMYVEGVLAGTGKVGNVRIKGAIAPGLSPGTISTGNLAFDEGGVYEFEIAGYESGQYDQINVTGTVNLGNGTLSTILLEGFQPQAGKSVVIINNDGDDAVQGTFAGLAEGATVEVDGQGYFTISYTGGDGNDVTLTSLPSTPNTGKVHYKNPIVYGLLAVTPVTLLAANKMGLIKLPRFK